MRLPRRLVQLEERLRQAGISAFGPKLRPFLASDPEGAGVLDGLLTRFGASASAVLVLVVQALRVQHSLLAPRLIDAAFVATLPIPMASGVLPTRQVVLDMLSGQPTEVIVLGYEVTDHVVVQRLEDLCRVGCAVHIIMDRKRADEKGHLATLPPLLHRCVLMDAKRDDTVIYYKMHSKALVVDGTDMLLTSANFTFHGLSGNIELGVRLRGAPVAKAREVLEHLLTSGLLERVRER